MALYEHRMQGPVEILLAADARGSHRSKRIEHGAGSERNAGGVCGRESIRHLSSDVEEFADGNRTLASEFYTGSEPLFPEMTRSAPPVIWPPDSEEYFAMLVDMLDAVWKAARKGTADEGGEPKLKKKKRKRDLKP